MLIQSLHEQRWDAYDGERAPNVAQTLVMIGDPAIPALQEFLEDCSLTEYQGQDKVLYVLERMGPKAKAAVPAVVRQLTHEHWEIREMAVSALGKVAKESEVARAALQGAARNERDNDQRSAARTVLDNLGMPWR